MEEAELKRLRAMVRAEKQNTKRAEDALAVKKKELKALRNSLSFRAGRTFTATPRALRRVTRRDR